MSKKNKVIFSTIVTILCLGIYIVVTESYDESDIFKLPEEIKLVDQKADFRTNSRSAKHFSKELDHEKIRSLLLKLGATDYQVALDENQEVLKIKTDIPFKKETLNKQLVEIEKNLIPLLLAKESGYFRFEQVLDNNVYFAEFKNGKKINGSFIKAQIEAHNSIISLIEPIYAPVYEH